MFAVFAGQEAQADGVKFDREMCALWAAAMREAIAMVVELERKAQRHDDPADIVAFAAQGAPRPSPMIRLVVDNVVDLSPILTREILSRLPDGGAA
jgi:hypothetical protein